MRRGNINNKEKEGSHKVNNTTEQENIQINSKDKDKLKVIILIVVTALLVLITTSLLVYKYIKNNKESGNYNEFINNTTEIKKESLDLENLVSFEDMYTLNPIKIVYKEYKNGTIEQGGDQIQVEYIQISGLVDNKIQNKINNEIKTAAFTLTDEVTSNQRYSAYTTVQGNFSNILSVSTNIYVYEDGEIVNEKEIFLNYNLVTGEQIKFLDLFADNTPMNSIIYDLKYEQLAWDTEIDFSASYEDWQAATDMDKRDTSEYEDIILSTINRYKKLDKNSISYYVTPSRIYAKMKTGEDGQEEYYSIGLYKYIDYITMYKKFQTDKKIYINSPTKSIFVFNDMMGFTQRYYKKDQDNLFISIFDDSETIYYLEQEHEYINEYSQEIVNLKNTLEQKQIDSLVKNANKLADKNKTKGYMARYMVMSSIGDYDNEYGEETFITVSLYGTLEEMDINYYNENAFKLLAKRNAAPKVSVGDMLTGLLDHNNKNIKVLLDDEDYSIYDVSVYYDLQGNLIANSYDELQDYLNSKYK